MLETICVWLCATTSSIRLEAVAAPAPVVLEERVMRITYYTWTGNKTASGKWPKLGMVASSDRKIKFGTKILVDGLGEFTVEDRTAKWVHRDRGDTVDIYVDNSDKIMPVLGMVYRNVKILK